MFSFTHRTPPAYKNVLIQGLLCVLIAVSIPSKSPAHAEEITALSAMPEVLLAAPVQATWAANAPDQWKSLGFSGLLFEGVLDELASNRDADAENTEALTRELRIAHLRLLDAGIPHNYLRTALAPEQPYFQRRSRADSLVENMAWLAALAQAAELPGLLLDTQSTSFVHDFRWDGYPLDAVMAPEIESGARRLGERLARAFYRNHPEGRLLLQAHAPLSAGPLWFHFFDGLLSGTGSHNNLPIHLLLHSDRSLEPDNDLKDHTRDIETLFRMRLSETAATIWLDRGKIAPGLEPIGRVGERPVAYYSPEQFRRRLLRSKIHAPAFVWVDAAQGGWWEYDESHATQYTASALTVGDRAISRALPELADYQVTTPLDAMQRVGPALHRDDLDAFVFYEDVGAAVLVWESLFGRWALPRTESSIIARYLVSGQEVLLFPEEDHVVVPLAEGPVLVRRLPLRDWVAPLVMDMAPDFPLTADLRRAPLRIRYQNLATLPMLGKLDAATIPSYSIGDALFDLNLAPKDVFITQRTLQGVFRAGDAVHARLTLSHAGGGTVQRTFTFPVQSYRKWRYTLDGALLGAPIVLDRDGNHNYRIVLGSVRGDLHAVGPDGALHWQRRLRSGMSTAPLAWEGVGGQVFISVTDMRGQIFTLDIEGELVWEEALRLEEAPAKQVALPQPGLSPIPADSHVSLDNTESLANISAASDPHDWGPVLFGQDARLYYLDHMGDLRREVMGQPVFVDAGSIRTPEGDVYLWRSFKEPAQVTGGVEIWTPEGDMLWTHGFEGLPSSPALIQHRVDHSIIWLGSSLGEILGFDLQDGSLVEQTIAPFGRQVRGLAHVDVPDVDAPWLLVLEEEGVHMLDDALEVQWFVPLRGGNAIIGDLPDGALLVIIATDNGDFVGITPSGSIAWRDKHDILPPIRPALLMDIDRDANTELLFGAGDGAFRVHDWQELLFPRKPLEALGSWGDRPADIALEEGMEEE